MASLAKQTVIRFVNLTISYPSRTIIQPFSATVRGGAKIVLVGANGCGKSSLLTALFYHQDKAIQVNSKVKMGYFHQKIANLQPQLSVVQNVAQTSIATATFNRTMLAAFGLSREFFEQPTSSLSSGQQVKVSLVKILMSDVNLLLLDEPSNFLDLMAVQALKIFLQERDLTVILVSHDQRLIDQGITIRWEIENNHLEVSNQ